MPRHNLTARFIDSIKPLAEGRIEYWDASTPGFGLRVAPSGRKTWVVMYRAGGRLRRLSLGTYPALSLGSAREAAKDALRDVAKGKDPAGIKQSERKAEAQAEVPCRYVELLILGGYLEDHEAGDPERLGNALLSAARQSLDGA